MLVALLATGKRAHFAFFILAIVIVYYYLNCDQPVKRGFKIVAIIAVGMFLLVLLVNYVPFIANNVNAWIDRFSSDNIDSGRSGLRVIALSLFKENSLFGIGWDGFMYSYASIFGTQIAVHMNYLQLLCEVGIIGAIPFFAFFAISFTHVINSLKEIVVYSPNDTDAKFFLAFATYYQTFFLLYCLTGNPLYDASTLFPYMASCAIGEFYFWKLRWDIL